jgi:hypothetical protein
VLNARLQARARSTSRVLRRHCRVSPQRRVIGFPCVPASAGVCAGQDTGRFGGCCAPGSRLTRGWVSKSPELHERTREGPTRGPDRSALIARTSDPSAAWGRCLPARKRGTVERTASNCVSGEGDACSGWGRRSRGGTSPEPFGICYGARLTGASPRTEGQRAGFVPQGDPKVASRSVPTEMGPVRKTRSGSTMTPPMGFGSFRRVEPR